MNDFPVATGLALMLLTCSIGFFTSWSTRLRQLRLWRWLLLALACTVAMLPLSALLRNNTLGWMAGLSLMFLLPVLLLLGIGVVLGHWFGTKAKVVSNAEGAPVAARATLRTAVEALRQRADGLLTVAGVGAGFVVVIGTGFILSGDPTPAAISVAYVPSIAVFLGVIGLVIRQTAEHWHYRSSDTHSSGASRRWKAKRQRFLVELAGDPVRRPYLALIQRGEHWSADRIAYDLDPDATATCEHLRPLEHAIRKAGVRVRFQWTAVVDVSCVIDAQALARKFQLAPSVVYTEPQHYDRSVEDPPSALISCTACQSRINAVHRIVAASHTPTWPEPAT